MESTKMAPAFAIASSSSSRLCAWFAPMAFTCAPAAMSVPASTGLLDVVAVQMMSATNRLRRTCGRYHRHSQPFRHLFGKLFAPLKISPIHARGVQVPYRGNRFQLRPRLPACSKNRHCSCILTRQTLRCDSGSGSRAELPQVIRFYNGQQIPAGHLVQRHQESQFAAYIGVLLHRDVTRRVIRSGHIVKKSSAWKLEPPAHVHQDFAACLLSRYFLNGFERERHREYGPDFRLGDMQSHRECLVIGTQPQDILAETILRMDTRCILRMTNM